MKIVQEYATTRLCHVNASIVIAGRDHEITPFIVTIKAKGELAVDQDAANGIYCKDLQTARMVVRKTIKMRGL